MSYNEKLVLELEADNNMSKNIDDASSSVKKLKDGIDSLGKKSEETAKDTESGFKKMTSSIQDGIDKIDKAVDGVNRAARHYNTMMSGFNRGVINLFDDAKDAVVDFTMDSIDNFTDLSEQHSKTLGAMANNYDKTAESQRKFLEDSAKLKDQAIELGMYGTTGKGAMTDSRGVSEAQTELVKAGLTADEILNGGATKNVLTFAEANGLNISDAVEFSVSLGNQFDIPVDKWSSMLDKVSHTADLSVIDVSEIVQSMKYASGISAGIGKSLEETLGMIGIMGNFGLRGSQAGSSIQALLTRILTGDTTVITDAQAKIAPPKALNAFNKFEKESKPNGELLPMVDVIDQLDEIMGTLNDAEQAWFAKKLFGLYQMKGAYALIGGDTDELQKTIDNIKNQSEDTNINKLNQILESQYGKLTSLNNMWEAVQTDMGDRLNPLVEAIRDELFTFLSNNGNYDINFDNLRSALDKASDLIEEKYGYALSNAVRNIGGLTIDFAQVIQGVAPEFASGLLNILGELTQFDVPGTIGEWNDMIADMSSAAKALPPDLRDMGGAVVGVIDMLGKLAAFNVGMQGLEGATNLVLLITNMSTALTTIAGLLSAVPGIGLAVAGIAALIGVGAAGESASANMDRESVMRNVFQFDEYKYTDAYPKITPGMNTSLNEFKAKNGISDGSDVDSLLRGEMGKYVYEQSLLGNDVTVDQYSNVLSSLFDRYNEIITGADGYRTASGSKLSDGQMDNTSFGKKLYKFDEYGNRIDNTATTLYSELYDFLLGNVNGMEDKSRARQGDMTTVTTTTTTMSAATTTNNDVNNGGDTTNNQVTNVGGDTNNTTNPINNTNSVTNVGGDTNNTTNPVNNTTNNTGTNTNTNTNTTNNTTNPISTANIETNTTNNTISNNKSENATNNTTNNTNNTTNNNTTSNNKSESATNNTTNNTTSSSYEEEVAGMTDGGITVQQAKEIRESKPNNDNIVVDRKLITDDNSNRKLISGENDTMYYDTSIDFTTRLGAAFSKDAWKYGYQYQNGNTLDGGNIGAALGNVDQLLGAEFYNRTNFKGWWYNGPDTYVPTEQELANKKQTEGMSNYQQYLVNEAVSNIDWSDITKGIDFGKIKDKSKSNEDKAESYGIQGWAAMTDQKLDSIISGIETPIEFTPQINVQAPTVNVDVTVDKDGNITDKRVSILNNGLQFDYSINGWFNRNSSQFGRVTK